MINDKLNFSCATDVEKIFSYTKALFVEICYTTGDPYIYEAISVCDLLRTS